MKSEPELSDKEWRQMRRQMSKLEFEPVPETPALLPRSLYGNSDKDLDEKQEDEPEEVRESAFFGSDGASSNHLNSPKKRSTTANDDSSDKAKQSEQTVKKDSGELPSTSMAVSPLITSRFRPREQKRLPEGNCGLDDADIAVLDTQMAAAQEATRRSVMRTFVDLKAKRAKTEALERMKLSAAHTNDVKILQSKVEELNLQLVRAEAQTEHRDLLLDRLSAFTAKQARLNQMRWNGERSLAACFRAWIVIAQRTKAKRCAFRHILVQSCKRQQRASFRHWKESVRGQVRQKQLEDQQHRYEHRIVEMAKEYQREIEQLQQEIDDAKCQLAESQDCRQKLEEDLRLIFLRGVSAMNIEALNVFGSNHKQNRKLAEYHRPIPVSRQQQSGKEVAESVTNDRVPAGDRIASTLPTGLDPNTEENVPALITVDAPPPARSTTPHSHASALRSSVAQAPPYLNRAANGWSRLGNTPGLRSAEMIRQPEFSLPVGRHSASRSVSSSYRPSSAPSPTKKKSSAQLSAKYQVEMQYMRSAVAGSASGNTSARPKSRSSLSAARSKH